MRLRGRGFLGSSTGLRSRAVTADTVERASGSTDRRAFAEQARALTPYLAVESGDLLFFVSPSDRLGRAIFVKGGRQDMAILGDALRLLREHGLDPAGSTFVDVGANLGTTTVAALRRYGFGRAVSIEPEPTNFRTLRLNLVANGVEPSVTAVEAAVSDRVGESRLRVSARSSGSHTLVETDGSSSDTVVAVSITTLDELGHRGLFAPDDVGLLWLDAAGAEAQALAGATDLLAQGVPIVTAVRPDQPSWPEARRGLLELLGGYTHFASLRTADPEVSGDLESILDSFTRPERLVRSSDILAFRA